MESQKYNKLVNLTKNKQTHRYREQTMVTSEEKEWGRGNGFRATNY